MSCNNNCNQGRSCDCYHAHFDHLGQPRNPPPWTVADALMVFFFVLTLFGLSTGFFK